MKDADISIITKRSMTTPMNTSISTANHVRMVILQKTRNPKPTTPTSPFLSQSRR